MSTFKETKVYELISKKRMKHQQGKTPQIPSKMEFQETKSVAIPYSS